MVCCPREIEDWIKCILKRYGRHYLATKTYPKKNAKRSVKSTRAPSLGGSLLTGARVLKPVAKGASILLDDVRRVVRALEPLALD